MYSLEVIEEIFLTLDVRWLEDENESYTILKSFYQPGTSSYVQCTVWYNFKETNSLSVGLFNVN